MTAKVVSTIKHFGLFSLVIFAIVSCEKEIENVGVSLIDNNNFSSNTHVSEIITTNENINRVPSNALAQYLLGVYDDNDFGTLKASIVTQITPPTFGTSYLNGYGDNTTIDSVIINIPYQSTKQTDDNDNGSAKFVIDSVFGNEDVEFKLSVYELKTFLNTLDPNDPSKNAIYYSDKEFLKGDVPFYSDKFKVNPNDTVSYIKRYLDDGITVYDTDTIKSSDLSPSINIPLDKTRIKELFLDNAGNAEFETTDNFTHFFRGFYIEASEGENINSHLISLSTSGAKMVIYYSKTQDEVEGSDLNGNGTTGESGVRTKHSYNFSFGTLKSNILNRDYSGSNFQQGNDERLFVQGAAGSIATVELFSEEDLTELRANNWLITNASLTLFVDQSASATEIPERLYIYNYDENTQITDALSEGTQALDGNLTTDDDGNPEKYIFNITDYISEVLKSDDPLDLTKLGIKVYNSEDVATTSVNKYGWNPKGVVLFNHHTNAGDKRIKLEITYTELN